MSTSSPILVIDKLSFAYAGKPTLDAISINLERGKVLAIMGGNGAGKSTLLKLLLGLLKPSDGRIEIAGLDLASNLQAVRRLVAYVPENVALYPQLSGVENLRYLLKLAGEAIDETQMIQCLREVKLAEESWQRYTSTYSKGMRQKLMIAFALLRKTPLLLLDEPNSGLDPVATRDLNELLLGLRSKGVSAVMVTHDLLSAAEIADECCILNAGKMLAQSIVPKQILSDPAALRELYVSMQAA